MCEVLNDLKSSPDSHVVSSGGCGSGDNLVDRVQVAMWERDRWALDTWRIAMRVAYKTLSSGTLPEV